jgi:hypothetical protein
MDLRADDQRGRGLVRAEVDNQEVLCHSELPSFPRSGPD